MEASRQAGASKSSRRTFLELFLGSSIVASLVSFLYPVIRYLIPPAAAELGTNTVLAGHVTDVPVNAGKIVPFGQRPALVIHTADGRYIAFIAVCTHLGCTVQYRSDLQQIWCPCHNGIYDLTGRNVSGPPPRPLTPLEVHLRGDAIYLARSSST
jgi:cytochrome b6-f complex iron-sulfur subunit